MSFKNDKDLQKFLKKIGYTGSYKNKKPKSQIKNNFHKIEYKSLAPVSYTPLMGKKLESYKLQASANFDIGQTYVKSGLQVLCEFDKNDKTLGKRR